MITIYNGSSDMYGMFSYLDVIILLLLLLLVIFLLSGSLLSGVVLALRCLWVSLLLTRTDSAPLGQLSLWSLVPLSEFLLPHGLQPLCSDNLSATLVQLLPVTVCPGVSPALVL